MTKAFIDGFINACCDGGIPMEKTAAALDELVLAEALEEHTGLLKGFREVIEQSGPDTADKIAALLNNDADRLLFISHLLTNTPSIRS